MNDLHIAVYTTSEAAYWVVSALLFLVGLLVLTWLVAEDRGRRAGRAEAADEQARRDDADVDEVVDEFGPLKTALDADAEAESGRLRRIK